jgi:hypothetical protein
MKDSGGAGKEQPAGLLPTFPIPRILVYPGDADKIFQKADRV